MAGEPKFTPLLLGLGLDEFSVPAPSLLKIKKVVRSVRYDEAKSLVAEALTLYTGRDIEALVSKRFKDIVFKTEN